MYTLNNCVKLSFLSFFFFFYFKKGQKRLFTPLMRDEKGILPSEKKNIYILWRIRTGHVASSKRPINSQKKISLPFFLLSHPAPSQLLSPRFNSTATAQHASSSTDYMCSGDRFKGSQNIGTQGDGALDGTVNGEGRTLAVGASRGQLLSIWPMVALPRCLDVMDQLPRRRRVRS